MKKILMVLIMFPILLLAADTDVSSWDPILNFFLTSAPWAGLVLKILGSIVVVGTFVDHLIPDEKDGGFMTKLLSIPVLGSILGAITRFSPFNISDKK